MNIVTQTYLNLARAYAEKHSGCTKVKVGSTIVTVLGEKIFGANRTDLPCRKFGCLRIALYGNNDKTHRGSADCRAIHSEIDAIASAAQSTKNIRGGTIYVTRYPCEACARAIVASGLKRVVYGRQQEISKMTREIFDRAQVEVVWQKDWEEDDATN